LWTLRTNLLKWIGPSHGSVPWKFVEKLFFNKSLISDLILLGTVDKHDVFQKKCLFFHSHFFSKKRVSQDFLPH
jgi:hypothetical protein